MIAGKRRITWRVCLLLLLVVLIAAVAVQLVRYASRGYWPGYRDQVDNWGVNVPREPEAPDTALPDLTARVREGQAFNADTVGWLYIPDTGIDAPILHTPEVRNTNNKYLSHNFAGERDPRGAYFADARAAFGEGRRGELTPLTTLYAHSFQENPASGMFSGLKYYRGERFAREHPYLYFSTWEENMAFEVVAVFEAHVNLPYNHCGQSVAEFEELLDAVFRSSLYDYGVKVTQTDRLLVLSTCAMAVQDHESLDPHTTEYRFVVMGRLIPPDAATKIESAFTVNSAPAPPDDFLHMGHN